VEDRPVGPGMLRVRVNGENCDRRGGNVECNWGLEDCQYPVGGGADSESAVPRGKLWMEGSEVVPAADEGKRLAEEEEPSSSA